ncbi:hypothetical protein KW805_00675 [Candidatus Pacearchaeota archaeon]|nr:hypothetical protein [Candidatus Pacearchaeota archaeon]
MTDTLLNGTKAVIDFPIVLEKSGLERLCKYVISEAEQPHEATVHYEESTTYGDANSKEPIQMERMKVYTFNEKISGSIRKGTDALHFNVRRYISNELGALYDQITFDTAQGFNEPEIEKMMDLFGKGAYKFFRELHNNRYNR